MGTASHFLATGRQGSNYFRYWLSGTAQTISIGWTGVGGDRGEEGREKKEEEKGRKEEKRGGRIEWVNIVIWSCWSQETQTYVKRCKEKNEKRHILMKCVVLRQEKNTLSITEKKWKRNLWWSILKVKAGCTPICVWSSRRRRGNQGLDDWIFSWNPLNQY